MAITKADPRSQVFSHLCPTQYSIFHPFHPNCAGHPRAPEPVQDSATQLSMTTVIQTKKQISVVE